ncbi:hypothetical protein MNBD_GAMMA12-510 [hydrothermal vent metagenome]|uniref:Uncharacterized protein n=1 Tax=hydrothermal vent metagenome TaxID=652676 RepID=A0A3B0YVY9_9ZZZZ
MLHKNSAISGLHLLGWLLAFLFCSAIWGMLSAGIAFQYNIPFDFFNVFKQPSELGHWYILGLCYGACIALSLVILEKFGAYNPVIAFVILMSGIILFTDMLFGRTSIVHSHHNIWLLLVPVVIIRDVVTYFYLRDLYRDSNEIHEINLNCKTIEEPNFDQKSEAEEPRHNTPTIDNDKTMDEMDQLAQDISTEVAAYGKSRANYA